MNYEILYIIPAKYSETEFEEINKKVPAIIEEAGAKIERTDNWGKRKLAYQIKHFRYGYYTLIIFSAPPEALEKITQKLNLNQDVIRFQIVKEIIQGARKSVTIDGGDFMVNKDGEKPREDKRKRRKIEVKKEEKETVTEEPKEKDDKMNGEAKESDLGQKKEETKKEEKETVTEEPKEKEVEKEEEEKPKKKTEKKKASIDKLDEKLDDLLNDAL
jgi:small subunit ribosomal protein S6